IHQPPTSKEEKLHSPLLFSQNKNNKQIKKEQLKIKMIQEENSKLKSNLSQYKNMFKKLQRDMKILKEEDWDVNNKNKKLQQKISELKENSLRHKVSRFFTSK